MCVCGTMCTAGEVGWPSAVRALAEALEATLRVEADFTRWKAQASAVRPKGGAAAGAAPNWNPTPADLESVDKSLAFIATQQTRAAKKRVAMWKEQKATVFSGLYGYHCGEGTLPEDGMEGLARGEDDERAFDAPLKVRSRAQGATFRVREVPAHAWPVRMSGLACVVDVHS